MKLTIRLFHPVIEILEARGVRLGMGYALSTVAIEILLGQSLVRSLDERSIVALGYNPDAPLRNPARVRVKVSLSVTCGFEILDQSSTRRLMLLVGLDQISMGLRKLLV